MKYIYVYLLLSIILADAKKEEYTLVEKHQIRPNRANFECVELLGRFTVSIFRVADRKAKPEIKAKLVLEEQASRVTSISVKFEARKFSAEDAIKLGEEVKTVVKSFEFNLPLDETRFLKMDEIQIGDVACSIYKAQVKVSVAYREDGVAKSVYYTFNKEGIFSKSEKFIGPTYLNRAAKKQQ